MSYDAVDVLAAFAAKRGITYPLLSDEGSHAIRALGLLNTRLHEQHAHYGVTTRDHMHGVPYAGVFILDQNGVVVEKQFEQSYRVRPTMVSLVEGSLGLESSLPGVRAQAATDDLQIAAWFGSTTYRPYQKLRLNIAIQIAPGLHVYAQPIPEGYTPLTVAVEPLETLEVGPLVLPEPQPLRVEGLDEDFVVYEGTIGGWLPLILYKNLGNITVRLRVGYQACSEAVCYPPTEVRLDLPLTGLDQIRD